MEDLSRGPGPRHAPDAPLGADVGPMSAAVTRHLVRHVEDHASGWLGQSGAASVSLRSVDDRAQSTQIGLQVDVGTAHAELVVKSPKVVAIEAGARGRLVLPVSDPVEKSRLEFDALSAMAAHFSSLADPRFGWVDVYDHLPSPPAIFVGRVEGPTFDQLLRHPGRSGRDVAPSTVLRNLGAWLAEYHSLTTPRATVRDADATEVIEGMLALVDAVSVTNRRPALPRDLSAAIRNWAPGALASRPTLGLGHGDFAPRNVFVGSGGRVTVIDSLGRFRVPIHEDLAYMLVELLVGAGRMRRRGRPGGRGTQAEMRAELLAGYGIADDPVLSVFELRALLDKWRSLVQRTRAGDLRGRSLAFADSVRRRLLGRRIEAILRSTRGR